MTTIDERQDLQHVAEEHGWHHRELDRTDVYKKGPHGVEAFFTSDTMQGGTLYEDLVLVTHTRDVAKVKGWLKK